MAAAAAAQTVQTVGKSELAAALAWTRPKLDRRLESDGGFPIKKRGTKAGGWEFDLAAVRAHLGDTPPEQKPPAIDTAQLRDAVAPAATGQEANQRGHAPRVSPAAPTNGQGNGRTPVAHQGEQTAKQRLDTAKATREEIKARREAGDAVDAARMRSVLTTMLARFGKGLDGMPEAIRSRLDLPDENTAVMRELIDEQRRSMVDDLREIFIPDAAVAVRVAGTDRGGSAKRAAPEKKGKRRRSRSRP